MGRGHCRVWNFSLNDPQCRKRTGTRSDSILKNFKDVGLTRRFEIILLGKGGPERIAAD